MTTCRSCACSPLLPVLSLGTTPLANSLLRTPEAAAQEERFPLDLAFCPECALVQITDSVPPEQLFSDYVYFSSFSDTMLKSAEELVQRLVAERGLSGSSHAIEAASNDGYLLQYYAQAGVPVLGIEPAANVAAVAVRDRGITTEVAFFTEELAGRLASEDTRADVFHANNVLAHVPDINGFVRGIAVLLKPDGIGVIEVPYLRDMIEGVEFDTIYHEHLYYFSLFSLAGLFSRHGLRIADVEHIPIHGGSLRIFVTHENAPEIPGGSERVARILREEDDWGVSSYDTYARFGETVGQLRTDLRSMLHDLKAAGASIAAYGASAKGSTLLNYCGIGAETLDFVADRSTVKQGMFTPGTHLPIVEPAALLERMPDYVLLLTWNFAEEILGQQAEYLANGGRFIIPVPSPRVVAGPGGA